MRIAQLTPGSGNNFYCENCLRDMAMVRAMRRRGADVLLIPMYLPQPPAKERSLSSSPIFFGGINVYLQQKWGLFRKTPAWFDRIFDSPAILGLAGRFAGMTSARQLGRMTVSMLRGRSGRQAKELDKLLEWLSLPENRVDMVCLSNVLLAGLAAPIKQTLNVPVVCMLQDEDGFIDGLGEVYAEQAWREVAVRAGDIDLFIAVSRFYADLMKDRLCIDGGKIKVIHVGICLDGFAEPVAAPAVPTIGFLSRMCSDRGLDTLVEAFIILKKNEKFKTARLQICGGSTGSDRVFLKGIHKRLSICGLSGDVQFLDNFDRAGRIAFLQGLSVLSVPEKRPVAYGLYVLESLAAGVPVVEPAHGVFKELIEETNGGLLYETNDAEHLAAAIAELLGDTQKAQNLAKKGRQAVFDIFNVERTAERMLEVMGRLCLNL